MAAICLGLNVLTHCPLADMQKAFKKLDLIAIFCNYVLYIFSDINDSKSILVNVTA